MKRSYFHRGLSPFSRRGAVRLLSLFTLIAVGLASLGSRHAAAQEAAPQKVAPQKAGGLLRPPPGGAVAPSTKTVRAVIVEQRTRGLPGPKGSRQAGRQVMAMDSSGKRLFMQEYRQDENEREYLERFLLVHMEQTPPLVYSISPDGSRYLEHAGDMNDLQRDRLYVEENQRKLAEQLSPRQRKQFYIEHPHLSEDGIRRVAVRREPGQELLGRQCERWIVEENNLTILDAQIATQFAGGASLFPLYQRLGAFSEEVLEKLREIKGVPLRGTITVVTALPRWTLDFEVTKLLEKDISAAYFELPPGAEQIVPEEISRDCPMHGSVKTCKKFIEDPSVAFRYTLEGGRGTVLLCSSECFRAYLKARTKKGTRRRKSPRNALPSPPKEE